PRQTTDGGASYAPHVGGSVFNTANALGRLGQDVGFFCGISTDFFGEMLLETLDASGVDTRLSPRPDRPTTLAFVKLTNGQAEYLFYDENSAMRLLSEDDIPSLGGNIEALFFGCISLAVEPCAATLETLLMREGDTRVTMIDPNIRTGFIQDEASYRARLDRMMAKADLIKVSDEDLHWLRGDGPSEEKARELLDMGPAIVCVTEGSKGVTGFTQNDAVFVAAPQVTVVDTVGAGDTFNGGFLTGLKELGALTKDSVHNLSPDQLEHALSLGARAAAITVGRAGANPPTRADL
ncbi:MAG: carbohydrate kinase, partial [Pseudomonadota bacterium]